MSVPACAKYEIIREMTQRDDNLLNISWLCITAGVSRSGYYHYLAAERSRQQREERDRKDFLTILGAYGYRGYDKGARGIYMRLLHDDPPVQMNIKKIRRLQNSMEYTAHNIDSLLLARHTARKIGSSDGRLMGQKKRSAVQNEEFKAKFVSLLYNGRITSG